jgi:hypothetical protein
MIFMPCFLVHWDPEFSSRKRKVLQGGLLARSFLRDRGNTLSELQRTIFEQNITRPSSFYLVLASTPGERMALEGDGKLRRVEIPWVRKGNRKMAT